MPKTLVWQRWKQALSPETAFITLFGDSPESFWLDSSRVTPGLSRFSFMGDTSHAGARIWTYRCGAGALSVRGADGELTRHGVDLFDELRRCIDAGGALADRALPFDFCGGFVGYLGYGLREMCGGRRGRASPLPDATLLYVERFLAFDHAHGDVYAVALADATGREAAEGWVAAMHQRLLEMDTLEPSRPPAGSKPAPRFVLEASRDRHIRAVERCQELIRDGHCYEVCLTNRLSADIAVEPLPLYRILRRRNPAPYAAYLRLPDLAVLCSSPERFLKIDRRRVVQSRPIKGTAPRACEAVHDRDNANALRHGEKDRAEHLMIVDLLRNDLGRVSMSGSVSVPELMEIESYATVHQMVSTIQGALRPDVGAIDAVRAAFPGGSMTGAPKLKAMEIIEELEGSARGVYSGALGWLSLDGTADLNIVIRTLVAEPRRLTIGIGGAVVAQSDPGGEFNEAMLKGEVLLRAVAHHVGGAAAEAGLRVDGAHAWEAAR
jgi:para-aminobenzoate synthetase